MTKRNLRLLLGIPFFILVAMSHPQAALAKNNLLFNPVTQKKAPYEVFPIEIKLDASDTIIGVDLDLTYNPQMVEIVKITPGTFFDNPQVLTNVVDKTKGTINYSLYANSGKSGSDTLVSLSVRLLPQSMAETKIKVAESTIVAGLNGKKLTVDTNETSLSVSLENSKLTTGTPQITSVPTFTAAAPTIYVVQQPQINTNKKPSQTGTLLKIVALIFLLGGSLAVFAIKKFSKNG